ncbi:2091_t:CDS:2 [Paraglomus occultum]|uniref:2091_t:CDS:1 n=1 Tax=Paraglomus occultum TaxID=144539 RepID=A0A9N9FRG0_9GLOM|nr:2091_t:CDS:2 [Paraglomus occultum]
MEMSDLTECIRDKLNQLRREKQRRYEQICQQLDQEIHQKTAHSRELYLKFEQAVTHYQKESEAPFDFDDDDSQKDDVSEEEEEVDSDDENHGRNGYGEGVVYGRRRDEVGDENGGLESIVSIGNLVNRETPMVMEAEEDMDGGKRANERSRTNDRLSGQQIPLADRSTDRLGNNIRKLEAKPKRSSRENRIRTAHNKCLELKSQSELVEESLTKARARLLFAREDYQRSLHAFDDLENELTSISQTFEETQKRALEQFFAGLNDKDVDVYEAHRKFHESATQEALERRGRKRKEIEELQAQVRGAKRIKNAALLTSVVALAPWIGAMALGLWEKFLILQGQLGE